MSFSLVRALRPSPHAVALETDADHPLDHSDDDWNPATYDEAKKSDNAAFVYCASKTLAEHAAWDFVKNEKVSL